MGGEIVVGQGFPVGQKPHPEFGAEPGNFLQQAPGIRRAGGEHGQHAALFPGGHDPFLTGQPGQGQGVGGTGQQGQMEPFPGLGQGWQGRQGGMVDGSDGGGSGHGTVLGWLVNAETPQRGDGAGFGATEGGL